MNDILKERTQRIKDIFPNLSNEKDLYGEINLPTNIFSNLETACKFVIYDCLTSFYKAESFNLNLDSEKFFEAYKDKIQALPNITPNGLVMPKLEILSSMNFLNKHIFALIDFLNLKDHCDVACPVNLRLNFGTNRSEETNSRPKSSTYWHTDIWAGQNSNELMVHTPIFGDFVNNGIAVARPPKGFFPDFVKTLNHYEDGQSITNELDSEAYGGTMEAGKSYIFDSFLFHKTISKSPGTRGIISFPVKLKNKVSSDIYQNPLRDSEYQTYEDWEKIGKEAMLVTDKKLEKFNGKDYYKNTYADKFNKVFIV